MTEPSTPTRTGAAPGPVSPVDPAILRARAYLTRVAEPPAGPVVRFVDRVGAVEAARRIRAGEGLPDDLDAATAARRGTDRAEADLAALAARGGRLLVPEGPDWPAAAFAFPPSAAQALPDLVPPLALWARGPASLADAGRRWVSVVGARAATDYGLWVAGDWSASFADAGVPVVSGAALGIDGAAHRGTLAAGGTTVAVLACGIDRPYPAAHTRLLEHVGERGLVVSEYPPGTVPARHRFLVRNRLVAALGGGTLVVEAGARSGAARTALVARLLARAVMVVPGPVTSALSVGCHVLAREPGTVLVGRAADVVEAVGAMGELAPDLARPLRPTDGLSEAALRVHGETSLHAARGAGRLAHDAGVDPGRVAALLAELEDAGLVEQAGDRWCRRPG